jgi:hypothetical protein
MKTIKIFLASSSELKEDRDQIELFIGRENARLHTKGIYLEIVRWENFLDAISSTRLQDEYNNAIAECDIVLCLFFTKVGKYTAEEFDTAYQIFKDKGKPKIWTYFKDAEINTSSITDEINTLLAFKKKIGELGHFYSAYRNIDNLQNQYRNQLDKFLMQFEVSMEADVQKKKDSSPPEKLKKPVQNTFNELLTKRLIEAIRPYNKKADDFLTTISDWETKADLISTVKRIIISGYVGVLGIQLRKLMVIGDEDFSESKMKRYLEYCHLTAKRALQLISYALISSLWDHQLNSKGKPSQTESNSLVKFFKNATEENLMELKDLLGELIEIFSKNNLELPIPQLKELLPNLKAGSSFQKACAKLQTMPALLKDSSFSEKDCNEAEKNLVVVLENLNFLAEYKMISIKDIDYNQQRNDREGLYLHNYTLIEGDGQTSSNNKGKVKKETSPVNSYAVLLFKDNYRKNINMVPFIIDYNGLGDYGESKICFYSFCNTYDDLNLNYSFIEDNSMVTIKKSSNPKPDDNNALAINRWLANPENRKDMNFDNVFNMFNDAKKILAGIEEESTEDIL